MPNTSTNKSDLPIKTAGIDGLEDSISEPKWNGSLTEDKLDISGARSSGNGGQNVNKVSTKAVIRFDVLKCDDLSLGEKSKVLLYLQEKRPNLLNSENVAIITCQDTRSFNENRKRAIGKLEALISEALKPQKVRIRKEAPESAKLNRLKDKQAHKKKKEQRSEKASFD